VYGNKRRIVTIAAGDLVALGEVVAKAKARFGMPGGVSIVSCYEAGRDGFWLHRYLVHCGVATVVMDASSIEVNRRARRAKTDRVDVEQLLRLLIRYHHGEKRGWSVVHVPSLECGFDVFSSANVAWARSNLVLSSSCVNCLTLPC